MGPPSSGSAAALVVGALVLACAGSAFSSGTVSSVGEAWHSSPPMLHARSAHAVASTPGAIYSIGGTGAGGAPVLSIERFDGSRWSDETTLPSEGLNAPAAVAIGSRIYVIGGFKTVTNVPDR